MYLYSDERLIDFCFICNNEITKNEITKNETCIQIALGKDFVFLHGWYETKRIFSIKVPYIKNNKYEIKYSLKGSNKNKYETKVFSFASDDKVEENYGQLTVIKQIEPTRAKNEYIKLQKDGLIGKVHFDRCIDFYDICCKACHHPDSHVYECLSNPLYGRVYKLKQLPKLTKMREVFQYNNSWYKKIPYESWYIVSWWNKEAYDKIKKFYYDNGLIVKEDETIDYVMLEKHNKEWPAFEDFWKQEPNHYYRNLKTGEIISEFSDNFNPAGMEQVVTKGWSNDHPEGSCDCPVCKRLYEIAQAGDFWIPKFGYFILRIKWKLLALKNHINFRSSK